MAKLEKATLAGGCFWCTEAIFLRLRGVVSVQSGYAGGEVENPTYEQVCTGTTGHAEAIQIEFDPGIISYQTILEIFWHLHDPTTKNRQGNDIGPQYRSAIFYHTEEQKKQAITLKERLNHQEIYPSPIVTEITPLTNFYKAESYHTQYYDRNANTGYCSVVIGPKIAKLLSGYGSSVKDEYIS